VLVGFYCVADARAKALSSFWLESRGWSVGVTSSNCNDKSSNDNRNDNDNDNNDNDNDNDNSRSSAFGEG